MIFKNRKVNVLGAPYTIAFDREENDPRLKGASGYVDRTTRQIVIGIVPPDSDNLKDMDVHYRQTLRHELVHAFAIESGLDEESDWALNEEMTSWIAWQFPKMLEVFRTADALQ